MSQNFLDTLRGDREARTVHQRHGIATAPVAVARDAVLVSLAPAPAAAGLRLALTRTIRGCAFGVARIIEARVLRRWAF
jgi:hypothetical protein